MILHSGVEPQSVVGLSPERLSIRQLTALAGYVVALEVYTPETVRVRRIEAIGETAEDCIAELAHRGLNPLRFEYVVLKAPW